MFSRFAILRKAVAGAFCPPPALFVLAFLLCGSVSASADELQTQVKDGIASVFNCTSKPQRDRFDPGTEDAEKLFDGDTKTKWCTTQLQYVDSLTFEFYSSKPITPVGYIFTTGNDNSQFPGRNPTNWTIWGKLNQDDDWTVLVSEKDNKTLKDVNFTDFSFTIDNNKQYKYFRMSLSGAIKSERNYAKAIQLSEFRFLTSPFDFNDCTVENLKKAYAYTGTPIDFSGVVVKDNSGKTLTKGTDYTVTVNDANGQVVESVVDAGKYHYVITGAGSYSNSYDVPFVVVNMQMNADGNFVINTKDDWKHFSETVNTGLYLFKDATVVLGNYVSSADVMVGTKDNAFSGTFDGQGYTLAFIYTASERYAAPFQYADGATIKNLRIDGIITTSYMNGAGLIANAKGSAVTISNCESSVQIVSSVDGDGSHGGFVGNSDTEVNITNCLFSGGINGGSTSNCGGFVGWSGKTVKISNSLITGSFNVDETNSSTFARSRTAADVSVVNSYFTQALGTIQGVLATDDRLKSGELTWTLQNGQPGHVWGQTLNSDHSYPTPRLFSEAFTRVYKITYQYSDNIMLATQFSNETRDNLPDAVAEKNLTLNGQPFTASTRISDDVTVIIAEDRKQLGVSFDAVSLEYGSAFTPKALNLPEDYNGAVSYSSDNANVVIVNGNVLTATGIGEAVITAAFAGTEAYQGTTVAFKVTVTSLDPNDIAGEGTASSPYIIKTVKGWDAFANIVSNSNDMACAKLASDLTGVTTMVGSSANRFGGTFDGDGHTLNVNYNTNEPYTAPFRFANSATIRNLRVTGTINTSAKFAAGIIADVSDGVLTITNCESNVTITSTVSGDGTHGGLVGNSSMTLFITNCIFSGAINGSSTRNCGGFVGWSNRDTHLTNCLLTASFTVSQTGSSTFARMKNEDYLVDRNCYYKNTLGRVQGRTAVAVTDKQLKSGEVAFKLQNGQTEQVWGQAVGKDDTPMLTTDADKRVLDNAYGDGADIYDNYVVVNEDKNNVPNIKKYTVSNEKTKLVRQFAEGWNTLVLPFSLTTEEVNNAFGENTEVAYFTNVSPTTIELNTQGDTKEIQANQPVLIKPSKALSDIGSLTFSARKIEDADEAKVSGNNGIGFIGSYAASYTVAEGQYFIAGDNLWKSKGETTVKATHAYFTVPETAGAKGVTLRLVINGGATTGISGVERDEPGVGNSAVYNLNGQKVGNSLDSLPRGIYIVNGKKFVKK